MASIRRIKIIPIFRQSSRRNLLICFLIFLTLHGVLGYFIFRSESPWDSTLVAGFTLAFLTLLLALRSFPWKPLPFFPSGLHFSPWTIGFPIILMVLTVFLRFFKTSSFSDWPLFDESMFGYFGINLSQHFSLRLFYTPAQVPPLFFWGLSLFLKETGISLSTFWLFPAILSTLCVPMVYLAAREFFKKPTTLVLTTLWAVSFWPLYGGRFCVEYPLFMFWELLAFYCLGLFLNAKDHRARIGHSLLLGLMIGAGFYISLSWVLIASAMGVIVLAKERKIIRKSYGVILAFLLPCLSLFWPLALAFKSCGPQNYILDLWSFGKEMPWKELAATPFSYLAGLFWGIPKESKIGSYGPLWGGLFNPLLASFLFLGAINLWKSKRSAFSLTLGFMSALFLTPALLTKDLEFYRMIQILPILLILACSGLQIFLTVFNPKQRNGLILGILVLSAGLDFYHLFGVVPEVLRSPLVWRFKSADRLEIYKDLKAMADQYGPGLILTEFPEDSMDSSLSIGTFPFNTAINKNFKPDSASWACLLMDARLQPFVAAQFPDSKWARLNPNYYYGNISWGIVPMEKHKAAFLRWYAGNLEFEKLTRETLNHVAGNLMDPILETFFSIYPRIRGDLFLESCFWARAAKYLRAEVNVQNAKWLLSRPAPSIYPADYLYFQMAKTYQTYAVFLKESDPEASQRAYDLAAFFNSGNKGQQNRKKQTAFLTSSE